jgi:hypothetical protein
LIEPDSLNDLLALAPHRIPDRAHRLLAAVSRRTTFFGETIKLDRDNDIPLAYARNREEFGHFVEYLHDAGLIKRTSCSPTFDVIVSATGFETLEARSPSGLSSDSAFVAMWFDATVDDAFRNGIKPAIEDDCGFHAVRIDLQEHNDDIVDRVLAEIRKARFVVADFTNHRDACRFP